MIPDTAHGTNPASVTMAGYELTGVKTDARGNIDLDDLRHKVDAETAGLMLTNPSTLGLFDENIEEIRDIFHGAGALMYYDGANLNAVCGISRPGDMGFDIVHINLHKTFSQPHGGGGPGGGPIAVREQLAEFLPRPVVVRDGDALPARLRPAALDRQGAGLLGAVRRLRPLVRVHACLGARPARDERDRGAERELPAGAAAGAYDLPYDRLCMHEFVLSARTLKSEHGITAFDVAKRLMDFGFHPPTVYFPLVVPEALMIEPTETEAKETLDAFADAMLEIAREARGGARRDQVRAPRGGRSAGSTRPGRSSSSSCAHPFDAPDDGPSDRRRKLRG